MVKGISPAWVLAIMAILAILSGSLRLAMAKRHLLQVDNAASWSLTNNLDSAVKIHCYEQLRDLGAVTLQSTQVWSRQWVMNQNFNEVFNCNFQWNAQTANFIIWAQDDPNSYLSTCEKCQWQIQADGFYFLQNDGQFVREVEWSGLN